MQGVAQMINPVDDGGRRLAFSSAVLALVATFAAAAAPIPLYNIYRAEEGFTNFGISMAIVTYSVGTMAALLTLGRLSNHLGRRSTAIASLGLLLAGCLLLLNVQDISTLLIAWLLVGLGTGLASSSLTPYIVDAAPANPEWLASVASSQGPMLGLTIGAIASGGLVQFGPWPRELVPDRAQLGEIIQRVRDGRLRTNIGNISPLDDAVAAFNPTERINGKTIIRVRA
jgi:MFS family permease